MKLLFFCLISLLLSACSGTTSFRPVAPTNFGLQGNILIPGQGNYITAIRETAGGKILFSANAHNATSDFSVYRLNADTTLDSSFGVDGKSMVDFGGTEDTVQGMALMADGRIILSGNARSSASLTQYALARFLPNGSLDTSFGVGGKKLLDFGGGVSIGQKVEMQSDGKILMAGYTDKFSPGKNSMVFVRLLENGDFDPSFGNNGIALYNGAGHTWDSAYQASIQSDGKIVLVGITGIHPLKYALVMRYNANGTLDSSFGTGGIVLLNFNKAMAQGTRGLVQSDGKILVTGVAYNTATVFSDSADFAIQRLNTNGSVDTSYGPNGNGIVYTDFGATEIIRGIALQPDGKLVAAGESLTGNDFDVPSKFAMARYLPNGSLDTTFGTGGKYTVTLSGKDYVRAMALQSNGAILMGGFSVLEADSYLSLAQIK